MTSASRCCRRHGALAVLFGVCLSSPPARAESVALTESQLTCLMGSGDWMGPRSGQSFRDLPWDGAGSRVTSGARSLRALLSRQDAGLWRGVSTTVLFRFELGLGVNEGQPSAFHDLSSFVGVNFELARDYRLGLRAFPFDTDYVRVGWLHALDWGGTDRSRRESIFLNQRSGAPGVVLELELPRVRLLSGVKWATSPDPMRGSARLLGVLAGASMALSPAVQAELGLGFFERPRSIALGQSFVEGASARLIWHQAPGEPEVPAEPLRAPSLRDEPAQPALGAAVALETTVLVPRQTRLDASARASSTAPALALTASWRGARLALHAAAIWRSLSFSLRDDTRVDPANLPRNAARAGELSGWLGGSFATEFGLAVGVEAGFKLPAALITASSGSAGVRNFVGSEADGLTALPGASMPLPLVAARGSLRQQLSRALSVALFTDYWHDPNRVTLADSSQGLDRSYDRADSLEVLFAARARF